MIHISRLSTVAKSHQTSVTVPELAAGIPAHARTSLNSVHITRDGRPHFPVSGEFHYSRVPREHWRRRLRAMRNGGLNTVASYVFWIHHQPDADRGPSFSGNLNLRAFVRECAMAGLDFVLRVGPWNHGEVRNGGSPIGYRTRLSPTARTIRPTWNWCDRGSRRSPQN